jgi:large subunit ribosomal protein L5
MNFKEKYNQEVLPKLKEKFGYKNDFEAPRIKKICLNVGFGRNVKDKGHVENVINTLTLISGQKPIQTKSKKSISAFKIREGLIIGAAVTLRGARMYDFFEKLIKVTFPRVRDFRGIKTSCIDNRGSLTVGFKEHAAFPEIKIEETEGIHGLEVSILTTAKNKEEGLEMFKLFGFPFKED